MSNHIFQLLGTTIWPALVGMAIVGFRKMPGQMAMPGFTKGGFTLFLKTWAVAFVGAFIFEQGLTMAGISEPGALAMVQLVGPAVLAYYFVANALASKTIK